MADYPISNVPRRIVYTGSAGVGPYAFNFEVLENTDITVYKNDVELTITTDYTVSISPTLGTGEVTLVVAATGSDRITIVGARAVERTTDFTTGGDFFANTLNNELDSHTILIQQVAETAERAIVAPVTDPTTINMTLPINTARAGKTLAFDADGNPVPGDPIGNWRGDWETGTTYGNRDLIKDTTNDNIYLCTVAHTSSGSLPIDTNADVAKWVLVVDAEAAGEARIAAEAAQAAAELAASNASTSATNAASSASSASTSASNASTSATNAASSASSASSSASSASSSASTASTAATTATTAATNASNSATAAASSASSASSSASSASTSATNASNSASAAATSETNAATSASSASTSASNAATSASNAATSETNAAASATSAAASFDSFDDRYLGAKSTAPTLDNDGDALVTGALYFNTVDNAMKVWNGSAWVDAYASLSGALIATNNLSDLSNAATARTNLGLGTLATQDGTFSGTSSGTNTGDQNLFSTIAVSGQSNVVADSTSDTLTLVAGTGVTITTDASADSVTINAATSIGKQTIYIPAGAMTPRTTNGAAFSLVQLGTNGTLVSSLAFDTATAEYAQFQIRMPKSWNESTVTFTPVWTANSTSTNSVAWSLRAKALGNDETIDAAWGTAVTVTDANTATAYQAHIASESSAVTIANASELEWVVFEIYRDVSNGSDTLAVDALLLGITIHYTTDAANDA